MRKKGNCEGLELPVISGSGGGGKHQEKQSIRQYVQGAAVRRKPDGWVACPRKQVEVAAKQMSGLGSC